ncbi:MAG: hypothetical protein ACLR6O_02050 [Eubacterium sp.]
MKTIREKNNVLLHNLESQPTDDGNVKIKAYLTAQQKNEDVIESIVGHVGREQGVISVGWKNYRIKKNGCVICTVIFMPN